MVVTRIDHLEKLGKKGIQVGIHIGNDTSQPINPVQYESYESQLGAAILRYRSKKQWKYNAKRSKFT